MTSVEEGRNRDSFFNSFEVEILSLKLQMKKYESRLDQRIGNIETAISRIQEQLLSHSRPFDNFNPRDEEERKMSGSSGSSKTNSPSDNSPAWIEIQGLKVKGQEDRFEIKKKFYLFLRETLGLSWEQIKGLSISDCVTADGDFNGKIKKQNWNKVLVKFDCMSDVDLVQSRFAVAEVQGYTLSGISKQDSLPQVKKHHKKPTKTHSGYDVIQSINDLVYHLMPHLLFILLAMISSLKVTTSLAY